MAGFWKVGIGGVLFSSGKNVVLFMVEGVEVVFVRSCRGVEGLPAELVDLFRQRRMLPD